MSSLCGYRAGVETNPARPRGRPRTSPLPREEQLRAAKQRQRERLKAAGIVACELRLPEADAARLRVASADPGFAGEMSRLLDGLVVDARRYPELRRLLWNRRDRLIPAREAFQLYERNWRFVDPGKMKKSEAALVQRLAQHFGAGRLLA